jgi:hypothetical protein
MINKIIEKKLILKKSTISSLTNKEKFNIKGGSVIYGTCPCYTEHKSCSLLLPCCPPAEKLDNETKYYC